MHARHVFQPVLFHLLYVTFTVIFWVAGGTDYYGNPYIYQEASFHHAPWMSLLIMIVFTIAAVPMFFFWYGVAKFRCYVYQQLGCIKPPRRIKRIEEQGESRETLVEAPSDTPANDRETTEAKPTDLPDDNSSKQQVTTINYFNTNTSHVRAMENPVTHMSSSNLYPTLPDAATYAQFPYPSTSLGAMAPSLGGSMNMVGQGGVVTVNVGSNLPPYSRLATSTLELYAENFRINGVSVENLCI